MCFRNGREVQAVRGPSEEPLNLLRGDPWAGKPSCAKGEGSLQISDGEAE